MVRYFFNDHNDMYDWFDFENIKYITQDYSNILNLYIDVLMINFYDVGMIFDGGLLMIIAYFYFFILYDISVI